MTALLAPSPTKRLSAAVLLGLCLLGASPRVAAETVQYRLGAQDRLRIHVYEWPALTGEFTVGADGMLSLPLIGQVSVTGLQTADLSQEISTRLKARAGLTEPPDTAVGIAQYRPFYVIGGVERSGEYTYRPGMLVLNAVSIAGGAYRRPESASSWPIHVERLRADAELPILRQKKRELLAREARLKAEIASLEKQTSSPATNPAAPEGVPGLTTGEQRMYGAQRSHQINEMRALQQSVTLHQEEIVNLKGQREAAEKLRQSVLRELAEVRELMGRGLTPTSRILPLERTLAQIEREQKELDAQALRARQSINTAERTASTVRDERAVAALRDLLEAQAQLTDTDGRIAGAERLMRESAIQAGEAAVNERDAPTHLAFAIVRVEGGEAREFEAQETTLVLPGDILKVQLVRREAAQGLAQNSGTAARLAEQARVKVNLATEAVP
ncbi:MULTISPECIES: polysaccharide biosynthesis/export family protein [Methylobacteriaceae]